MSETFDPTLFGGPVASDDPSAPDVMGVSLDDLFQVEIDEAEVQAVLSRSLIPRGTYITNPEEFGPFNAFVAKVEERDDAGQVYGHRLVVTLTGRAAARVRLKTDDGVKEETAIATLRYQISPDGRKRRDADGFETMKDDLKTRLWAEAVAAFKADFGEAPKNAAQLVEYLQEGAGIRLTVIHVGVPTRRNPTPDGEPRAMVFHIYPSRRR